MEEDSLIICEAILDVHLLFLYLVALPEKFILYPLNLQMTKKQHTLEMTLELTQHSVCKQYREGKENVNKQQIQRVSSDRSIILRWSKLNYNGLESERKKQNS